METQIIIHLLPHEIDWFEWQAKQLKIGSCYIEDKIVVDVTLNLNLVDWSNSQIPKQYFIDKFYQIKQLFDWCETIFEVDENSNCLGIEPDLIIIDYIDLLSTRKRNVDRKGEIDDIYTSTKGLARELNIPIWSVSQVNRAGAKDDIIEGDKAAGSYDKMMITDLSMSLSRKKEDKVNGTGRLHIMKNRYGMDGLTFQVDVNTSNGHISVGNHYDEEADTVTPKKQSNDNFDDLDKRMLANKFFELNT